MILELLGHKVGDKALLKLRTRDGNSITHDVAVTRGNRISVWNARNVELQEEKPGNWLSEMMRRLMGSGHGQVLDTLTAVYLNEDLGCFERRVQAQFAYLRANDVDLTAAVDRLREEGRDGIRRSR